MDGIVLVESPKTVAVSSLSTLWRARDCPWMLMTAVFNYCSTPDFRRGITSLGSIALVAVGTCVMLALPQIFYPDIRYFTYLCRSFINSTDWFQPDTTLVLPDEILANIFEHLGIKSAIAVAGTCSRWRRICREQVWVNIVPAPVLNSQFHDIDNFLVSILALFRGAISADLSSLPITFIGLKNLVARHSSPLQFKNHPDAMLSPKCEPSKLTYLRLADCYQITDEWMSMLASTCRHLAFLDITGCAEVSWNGIETLFQSNIHVCGLHLGWQEWLKDAAILQIATRYPNLTTLGIAGSEVSDGAIRSIANICHKLDTVEFDQCSSISATGLADFVMNCPSLNSLSVRRMPEIPQNSVTLLWISSLHNLVLKTE